MCEGDERTVLKAAHIESSAEIFYFFRIDKSAARIFFFFGKEVKKDDLPD